MSLLQDVRFAIRVLVKNRWFTLIGAVVLALGIGANNAVFTLVNAVLLRGLLFPKSGRDFTPEEDRPGTNPVVLISANV